MTDYQKNLNAKNAAAYLGVTRTYFYELKAKYKLKVMGREAQMNLYSLKQLSGVKRTLDNKRKAREEARKPL